MSEGNAGISICRRNFSQGSYSNIIFPLISALFLSFLQDEYLKYFEWKKEYVFYHVDPYCTLCHKLHSNEEGKSLYENMTQWFYYDKQGSLLCTDGSEREYFQSVIDSIE